ALLQALASGLGLEGVPAPTLPEPEAAWIAAAAAALARAGPRGLLRIGRQHEPAVQALAILVNERLGNRGTTQWYTEPDTGELEPLTLADLVGDAEAGGLSALLVLGCNPLHSAPGDLPMAEAFDAVPLRVHAGLYDDETAGLCHWHAPIPHDLESWSDARAADGSVVLLQPLVRPFLSVRSPHVLLDTVQGRLDRSDREIVQDSWRGRWGNRFEENWTRSLHRGIVAGSIPPPADLDGGAIATPQRVPEPAGEAGGIELIIRPDPCIWDGRFAANPWLQELPRPLTKLTWDAPVLLSPALAADLGVADEDLVSVTIDGGTVVGPALAMPGQAARTVVVFRGFGRSRGAGPATGIGYNAVVLDRSGRPTHQANAAVTATGDAVTLAITQRHDSMEGQPLVRTVAAADADARGEDSAEGPPPSFHPLRTAGSPSWGMSIDLDLCIGCNACVAACVAENNIPMVGAQQVAMGREMHWLRIDRYRDEDGAIQFQPVPCMHCEQAPCEMGCPVNATVHSGDGLNLQVYNRCIGTRTCSSYCPYKVRRFNWFDLTGDDPEPVQAARNPDVTVRGRGVMEKCTYCIQRISAARIAAKLDDRPIADGEVRTACQQACPTRAIVFGDVTDPGSAVSRRKAQPRDYTLLEEVNTRPRTTYLARIRAPGDGGSENGEDAD
ncbi:MAG: 4Fe-4S dicluster domain-containing protein, partial [Alphaproteobacteria bacterium]